MAPHNSSVNPQTVGTSVPLLRRQLAKRRGKNIFNQVSSQNKTIVKSTASDSIINITHRGLSQVRHETSLLQNVIIKDKQQKSEIVKRNSNKIMEHFAVLANSDTTDVPNPDLDYVDEIYSHLSELESCPCGLACAGT